jgi:hypothetical protein
MIFGVSIQNPVCSAAQPVGDDVENDLAIAVDYSRIREVSISGRDTHNDEGRLVDRQVLSSRNKFDLNQCGAGIVHGAPALIGELLHCGALDIATFVCAWRTELVDS